MAQRVPAGPSWDPRNQRASVVASPACAETLAASAGRGLLASCGSPQSPFPTTAVYWPGVLSSRVPEPLIMARSERVAQSGSRLFFVFIDRVPIALERALR